MFAFMRMMFEAQIEASEILYRRLENDVSFPGNLTLEPHQGSYCFLISGFTNLGFNKLSVSYPPDCNRDEVKTIETALFLDEKLVYINDLDYEDICRFFTYEELMEEIKRLNS